MRPRVYGILDQITTIGVTYLNCKSMPFHCPRMRKLVFNNYEISVTLQASSDENGQWNALFEIFLHINKVVRVILADLCSSAEKALKT